MGDTFFAKTLPALGALLFVAAVAAAGIFIVGISKPPEPEAPSQSPVAPPPALTPSVPPAPSLPQREIKWKDFSDRLETERGKIVTRPSDDQLQIQLEDGLIISFALAQNTAYFVCEQPVTELQAQITARAGAEAVVAYTVTTSVDVGEKTLWAAAVDMRDGCS